MKPIVKGIDNPMKLELSEVKRPTTYNKVKFECPSCSEVFDTVNLAHGDPLEYGDFYSPDECYECGQEFEEIDFEVTATISIKIKGED